MSSHRDDDDRDDYSGSRKSSRLDSAPKFDSTKLVGDDGQFMGMKLSKDLAGQINTFYPALLDYGRKMAEKIVGPAAERLAKQMGHTEAEALHFRGSATDLAGYGVIFLKPGTEAFMNVYQAGHTTAKLNSALKPLGKEGRECETVDTVWKRTRAVFGQNMIRTATGLISTLPAWYSKVTEQTHLNEARKEQQELAEARKNPEAFSEWLKNQEVKTFGGDASLERQAREFALDQREKEMRIEFYGDKAKNLKGFFESAEAEVIRKRVKDDLGKLPSEPDDFYEWSKLERYGIPTRELKNKLLSAPPKDPVEASARNSYRASKGEIWEKFRKEFEGKSLKAIQENEVKLVFAQKKGAMLEHGWITNNPDKLPTVRDQYAKTIDEKMKSLREAEKATKEGAHGGKNDKSHEIATAAAGIGAGFVGEMLANFLGGTAVMAKYKEPTAWDYIGALKEIQHKAIESGDNLPNDVPLEDTLSKSLREAMRSRSEEAPRGASSYALVIHEIIQRNESERGRSPVHRHEFEHFEKAGWDDKKIQDIPESELTAYELAVSRMAKLVQTGQLAAIALNLLVGHPKYKITSVIRGDQETAKKAVLGRIDTVMENYRLRDDVDEEKATQARGGFVPTDEEIRAALTSFDGDAQAFMVVVFSDVLNNKKKVCQVLGKSETQCDTLNTQGRKHFNALLDAAVVELADLIENDPKAEEKLDFGEDEKKTLISLAKRIEEHGKNVAEAVETREELKTAETAVANAVLAIKEKQEDGKGSFWQRVVERMRKPKPEPLKSGGHSEMEEGEERDEDSKFTRHASEKNGKGKKRSEDWYDEENKAAAHARGEDDFGSESMDKDGEEESHHHHKPSKRHGKFADRFGGGDGESMTPSWSKRHEKQHKESGLDSHTPSGGW